MKQLDTLSQTDKMYDVLSTVIDSLPLPSSYDDICYQLVNLLLECMDETKITSEILNRLRWLGAEICEEDIKAQLKKKEKDK